MRNDLTVCPYCRQDYVLEAKVKKTGQVIRICFECDTVWEGDISDENACAWEVFIDQYELSDSKDEFEYMESIFKSSIVVLDEYHIIPLDVLIGKKETDGTFVPADYVPLEYILFDGQNGSLLEIDVDLSYYHIKRIVLVQCREYTYKEEPLLIYKHEDSIIKYPKGRFDCDIFRTIVYADGVRIVLSDKEAIKYRRTGDVYIGVSNTNDIMEICVCNMYEAELEHLKTVLERQSH